MNRAKRICNYPGCNVLINIGHRCSIHKKNIREELDYKKTDEDKKFYSSSRWTETSIAHRIIEPLCRKCLCNGLRVEGYGTHHNPSRKELLRQGKSPFDHKYLETICFKCHQKELRAKRKN